MENYLKEMLVTLADGDVEFVVGGGVACVLHGVERVTLDLDVAVQMNSPNLDRLICAVEKLNLQPRVPVSLADIGDPDFVRSMVKEKEALVFSLADFNNPLRHLDIFLSPTLLRTFSQRSKVVRHRRRESARCIKRITHTN
jgi:hypothetical protein